MKAHDKRKLFEKAMVVFIAQPYEGEATFDDEFEVALEKAKLFVQAMDGLAEIIYPDAIDVEELEQTKGDGRHSS